MRLSPEHVSISIHRLRLSMREPGRPLRRFFVNLFLFDEDEGEIAVMKIEGSKKKERGKKRKALGGTTRVFHVI